MLIFTYARTEVFKHPTTEHFVVTFWTNHNDPAAYDNFTKDFRAGLYTCGALWRSGPGKHIFCLQILQFHLLTPLCHLIPENIAYTHDFEP